MECDGQSSGFVCALCLHLYENLGLAHDLDHLTDVRPGLLQHLELFSQESHCDARRGVRVDSESLVRRPEILGAAGGVLGGFKECSSGGTRGGSGAPGRAAREVPGLMDEPDLWS